MKTISFKSIEPNFRVEYLGLKSNTLREIDISDIRDKVIQEWLDGDFSMLNIEIINPKSGEKFTREVTDITQWKGWTIISWR